MIFLALTAMMANFKCQTSTDVCIPPILPIIMCYSSSHFLLIHISNVQNAKISLENMLRPLLWRQLALTTMLVNFLQQVTKHAYPIFANDHVM